MTGTCMKVPELLMGGWMRTGHCTVLLETCVKCHIECTAHLIEALSPEKVLERRKFCGPCHETPCGAGKQGQ